MGWFAQCIIGPRVPFSRLRADAVKTRLAKLGRKLFPMGSPNEGGVFDQELHDIRGRRSGDYSETLNTFCVYIAVLYCDSLTR